MAEPGYTRLVDSPNHLSRRGLLLAGAAAAAASPARSLPGDEICGAKAVDLARLLRKKKLSAREVLDACLARIEAVNPKVNAVVTLVADQARKKAAELDEQAARGRFAGPLHGLPIAHKDLQDTAGIRTTYGSPLFRDYVPTRNTLLIDRIQQAGAVTIGKTNVPEFGAGSQTFNPVFGAAHNPYDLSKTTGGSSGGAAAALACGMIPLADGSDTGGSLRNPAAFCGVVGFRTSPGRSPRVPTGTAWNTLSVVGPMGRSAEDVGLMLSAIAGPDLRIPLSIQEPGEQFAKPLDRDFRNVRVAWCAGLLGLPFDKRVRAVFDKQRAVLESLGCRVTDAEPDLTGADEVFKVFRAMGFYQQHAAKAAEHRDQIKATVLEEVDRGAKLTGPQITRAEGLRSKLHERVGDFLKDYEYFVLPTTQVPAFSTEQEWVKEIDGRQFESYIDWMRSCYYVTVTALPAISVPAGLTPEGLPVGFQIVGRVQADFSVLQLAHAFEQARGPLPAPAVLGT
ncbi:MAG: amidase [Acidobacteria bacterium]|nr:amidase [Acidobacteriota bacterium]